MTMLDRTALDQILIDNLRTILMDRDRTLTQPLGPDTHLIGPASVLDSIGLVTLLADVEDAVNTKAGAAITIADDRAMSQRTSPFRTVGSLGDYIARLLSEPAP